MIKYIRCIIYNFFFLILSIILKFGFIYCVKFKLSLMKTFYPKIFIIQIKSLLLNLLLFFLILKEDDNNGYTVNKLN